MSAQPTEGTPETMPDGTTVRPWAWFDDGPGSPYLATVRHGRLYVMGFVRKGMQFAQPVFQVRENRTDGVMRTATEIGPDWKRHPDAALIVAAVNDYDRLLAVEAAAREWLGAVDEADGLLAAASPTLTEIDSPAFVASGRRVRSAVAALRAAIARPAEEERG